MVRDQIGLFMTIERISILGEGGVKGEDRDLCVIVNGFSISDLLVKWMPFVTLLFVDLLMTVNELGGALSDLIGLSHDRTEL